MGVLAVLTVLNSVITSLLLFTSAVAALNLVRVEVGVTPAGGVVRPGEDLTISCRVTQTEPLTYFVRWRHQHGLRQEEIGTNTNLEPLYKDTNRYALTYTLAIEDDYRDVTFMLSIKDARPGDSGHIECAVPQHVQSGAHSVAVLEPVESVAWYARAEGGLARAGPTLTLEDGQQHEFVCRAEGSYPQPHLRVLLGNRDITDMFEEDVKRIQGGDVAYGDFDVGLSYTVTLTSNTLPVNYQLDDAELICRATIPDTDLGPEDSLLAIQLTGYAPHFECPAEKSGGLYQKEFTLTCVVLADPPVSQMNVLWSNGTDNVTLTAGSPAQGHYTVTILPGTVEQQNVVTLTIDRLFEESFRQYFFQAENSMGSAVHTITLVRDLAKDQPKTTTTTTEATTTTKGSVAVVDQQTGGASHPTVTPLLALCSLLPLLSLTARWQH